MKIEQHELASKLGKIKSVVGGKINEAMQGVLLKNNTLIANNIDMAMIAKLGVETDECFIIPVKVADLIAELPSGLLEITCSGNALTIKCGKTKSSHQTYFTDTFVEPAEFVTGNETVPIQAKDLAEAVNKVIFAVDENNSKAALTGVSFKGNGSELSITGCDGYRIAMAKMNHSSKLEFIIPKSAMSKVISLKLDGEIEIAQDKSQVAFISKDITIITRQINGEAPAYEKMIPDLEIETAINRLALIAATRRAMFSIDTEKLKSPLVLSFKKDKVEISGKSQLSAFKEEIEITSTINDEVVINVNPKYVLDAMKSLDCEEVDLKIGTKMQPIIYSCEKEKTRGVILPIR